MIKKTTGAKRLHRRFVIQESSIIEPLITKGYLVYGDIETHDMMVEVEAKKESELFSFIDSLKEVITKEKCLQVETVRTFHKQQSPKWHQTRRGFFTSSTHWVSKTGEKTPTEDKKSEHVGIDRYIAQLPSGDPLRLEHEAFNSLSLNAKLQRGNDLEKVALALYEKKTGFNVDMDVDFRYVKGSLIGTSIDGLANGNIINEVKCPSLYNYMDDDYYMKHYAQIQQHLYVFGLTQCDFIVYFPSLPIRIKRVEIDYSFIYNLIESEKRVKPKVDESFYKLMGLHLG